MGKELVLPKNIRQIGDIQGREKIFLEDYVMTYIKKKEKQEQEGYLGIFLGERKEKEGTVYVFIRGILEVPTDCDTKNSSRTTESAEAEKYSAVWTEQMERDYQEYFPESKVQGCCVIGAYPTEQMRMLLELIPETGGLIYHLQEQEETLYRIENGRYRQIKGYFVFYEQNRSMQEYMANVFQEDRVEKEGVSDKAIRSFRKKVKEKGIQKNTSFLKLASSFFVVTVLVIGVIVVNRIEDIRGIQGVTRPSDTTAENEILYVEDTAVPNLTAQSVLADSEAEDEGAKETEESNLTVQSVSADSEAADEGAKETAASNLTVQSVSTDSEAADELVGSEVFWNDPVQEAASVRQLQAAYVIREGDTLAEICTQYYGSLDRLAELCEINEIADADKIMPGQKIVLP